MFLLWVVSSLIRLFFDLSVLRVSTSLSLDNGGKMKEKREKMKKRKKEEKREKKKVS